MRYGFRREKDEHAQLRKTYTLQKKDLHTTKNNVHNLKKYTYIVKETVKAKK